MAGSVQRILTVLALCRIFSVDGANNFCVTTDNRRMPVGTYWFDDNNCSCECVSLGDYIFSQCNECLPAKKVKVTNMCVINGRKYIENEKWLSTEKECSICQCKKSNTIICDSTKHCMNPCHEGQIPQFGPCCQIINCYGNATIVKETQNCTMNGSTISHGKGVVQRLNCKDKYCTCINGHIQCFEYCELSRNSSHQFWDKSCCPRRIGYKTCLSIIGIRMDPGEVKVLSDGRTACRCLDGEIYCSKELISFSNGHTSQSNEQQMFTATRHSAAVTLSGLNTSDYPQLNNNTKQLLAILFIIFFVLLMLTVIIIIIRMQYVNLRNMRQRKLRRENLVQDDTQELYH